ncbi:D-isomer specific 2-hydroxyacid dehydrogenase [Rickenella mellea]|uniref:D-isomer specific 2-hydroxyacid dehydrogenase n=1 Tax=Rickenella mellea TaxID=50990 RepID=A0A4Y7QMS4_9AGAM|nr:D-isomer specific 2-hydroxyacid dehydrogenase [Rickenella mellea]
MADLIRVAILDDYQHVAFAMADWSPVRDKLIIDVFDDTIHDEDALAKRLLPYTIICAMRERTKFSASLLDRLPNLKFIATTGRVNRGIDLEHAERRGVVVSGTGFGGNSTLEHIWALILATVRHIAIEDRNVKAGKALWQSHIPVGLSGKTLGLIGVGHLGSSTAKIAKAFNMQVVGWSPNLTQERADAAGVQFAASKEELIRSSDIVSIHMVLSPATRHMITAEDFSQMRQSAFFINTSRGPLVDEAALVDALTRKTISGAGLDVFDLEPLPSDHPLRRLGNVTLTPHTGYVSDDNYKAFWSHTVENIEAFLQGKPKRALSNSKL